MSGINTRFREQYKKNVLASTGAGRCRRAQKKLVDRRVSRIEEFSRQRNLAGLVEDSENRYTTVDARKLRLRKWKEEKLQQSLLKKSSEKPVFRCGVVHHKMGSPYLNDISNVSHVQKTTSSTMARLERLRLRQKTGAVLKEDPFIDNKTKSFAPLNFKFKPPQIRSAVTIKDETRVITSVANKSGMSRKNNESIIQQHEDHSLRRVTRAQTRAGNKSNEPVQYSAAAVVRKRTTKKAQESSQILHKVPRMEPVIENSIAEESATPVGTENLKGSNSPKPNEAAPPGVENVNTNNPEGHDIPEQHVEAVGVPTTPVQTNKTEDCFPIQYSPFVTKGRGSLSRRSHLMADASEKSFGDVSGTTGSSSATEENRQHGVLYFRSVLDSETKRLDIVCQEWLQIKCTEPGLPPEASDLINVAVGQTQLLLTKKFCQFRDLIDTCENGSGTDKPSVTCSDLDGFWDMMYMQVENVDLRFSNLQKLKLNNWKEEVDLIPVEIKRPVAGGSKKVKKVQKSAKSSLRAMIAAVRKKKQEINAIEVTDNVKDASVKPMCTPERVVAIRVGSTPLLSHQSRTSLLQRTLLEEHRRYSRGLRRESSPIIMKVTQMAKMCDSTATPTLQFSETAELPSTCNPPLSNQTPKKSILKSVACHLPEPVNKTLFNDNQKVIGDSIMKVQDPSDETKETELYKPRRSVRISTARRVRFEGTQENSPKEAQPMTPYISHSQRPKRVSQRLSLLGSMVADISATTPLASGDLICLDSPVSGSRRVTRRSSRLSVQTR